MTMSQSAKNYRTYECVRNDGGGLDPVGADWTYYTAGSARQAARDAANVLRAAGDVSPGTVVVATDDDGDSAETTV